MLDSLPASMREASIPQDAYNLVIERTQRGEYKAKTEYASYAALLYIPTGRMDYESAKLDSDKLRQPQFKVRFFTSDSGARILAPS